MNRVTRKPVMILLSATLILVLAGSVLAGTEGYIYGKVTTRNDKVYQGPLRWGSQEAFWDDLFNSAKEELPFMEYKEEYYEKLEKELEDDDNGRYGSRSSRRKRVSILGGTINIDLDDHWVNRQFIARFGDIKKLEVIGSEDAFLTMRDGTTYEVSGYSDDVGTDITVYDPALGSIELPWRKIDTVEFLPTPSSATVPGERIQGKVFTDAGNFEGYIQWDHDECLSIDKLDGDSDDGRISVKMGQIKSIERRSRRSAKVTLLDGREFILDGTNDVNDENRGIFVEDPRYGRVSVSWDAFEKAEFVQTGNSGRSFDSYTENGHIEGEVETVSGEKYAGRVVFDLDESERWEMLNGDRFDVEYYIPFYLIQSISPRSRNASEVILKNGEKLRLEDSHDVNRDNDGVLIMKDSKSDPVYVPWEEIEIIKLK